DGQRRDVDHGAGRVRRDRRLRPLQHATGLRTARADLREPALPPPPPQARRTPRRQYGVRADDLGPDLRARGVPHRRHDPDRHRAPRTSADRRAGGAARATPRGLRRADGCALPTVPWIGRRASDTVPDSRGCGGALMATTTTAPTAAPAKTSRVRLLLAAVLSTRTAPRVADVGLLIVRLTLAFIFIYHGSRRLFGWFDGPGLDTSADYFANTAHLHPGMLFAIIGGTIEFAGGI